MTLKPSEDSARIETLTWQSSHTREIQGNVTNNLLIAQTETLFIVFKLNTWSSVKIWNSGSLFLPQTTNIDKKLLIR